MKTIGVLGAGQLARMLAIGKAGAINAALLACSIVGNENAVVREALRAWRTNQSKEVLDHPDPRS